MTMNEIIKIIKPYHKQIYLSGMSIGMLVGAYIAVRILNAIIEKACKRSKINMHLQKILTQAVRYTILGLSCITVLENFGVKLGPLMATLGVTGIAIGFAVKDVVSNIIAGILILFYKPFSIGDYIKVKDGEGTVINIDLRCTTLQNDDRTCLVPNSLLYANTVAIFHKNK